MVSSSLDALLYLVTSGRGIACVPDFSVKDALAEGRLQLVLDGCMTRSSTFRVLWPSSKQISLTLSSRILRPDWRDALCTNACPPGSRQIVNVRFWPAVPVRGQSRQLPLAGKSSGREGRLPSTAACSHSRCIADVHQLDLLRSHRWGRQEGLDDVMVVAPPRRKVQTATAAVVHSTLRTWQDWEAGVARMHPGLRGTVPTESRSGGSGVKSELKGCMP